MKMNEQTSLSFQDVILKLQTFWARKGCAILQPYDMEVGAGTFHPATTLRVLGPKSWRTAYVQPSRRPTDGRYGCNPNRVQRHHQFQVIMKPAPDDCQDLYLQSLQELGLDTSLHDIRFVEDNWEGPTLGAAGLGWEIWCDGQEISQFTYLQQMGGIECQPVAVELTYGLERIASILQKVDSFYDLNWNGKQDHTKITYRDIYLRDEKEFSAYNFEYADVPKLLGHFEDAEQACQNLLKHQLALPAYDQCLKASHLFNLLEARGVISTSDRANFITRVRALAKSCCQMYINDLEESH